MSILGDVYINIIPEVIRKKLQPLLRDYFFYYILKIKGGKINVNKYTIYVDCNDKKGLINYGNYLLQGSVDVEKYCLCVLLESIKINSNLIFVDIGANYGMYTLAVCAEHSSEMHEIISIEPDSSVTSCLERSIRYNEFAGIVKLYNAAVGLKHNGVCRLVQHKTQSSFNYTLYENDVAINVAEYNYGPEIPTVTVDGIFDELLIGIGKNIIAKIDVEGNEITALRGMSATFANCAGYQILLEFSINRMEIAGHNYNDLINLICEINPDYIYHLDERAEKAIRVNSRDYYEENRSSCMNLLIGKNMNVPNSVSRHML